MHDVTVTLDPHLLRDTNASKFRDSPQIVSRQVEQHHMFGALFRIGEQIRGIVLVLLRGSTALARACNWSNLDQPIDDTDVHFRRASRRARTRRRN